LKNIKILENRTNKLDNRKICDMVQILAIRKENFMSHKNEDKDLLEELIRIKDLIGKVPRTKDVEKYGNFSINSYKRAFGGISNALIKIGESPTFLRNQTKNAAILEIKRIYNELERIPTAAEFSELSSMTFATLRKITNYQSWHSLLKESGISDEEMIHLKKHNVTDDELKEEIIRLKNIIGRYPTYYDMQNDGKYSCNTYEQRFGTWIKALHALGFADYIGQSIYKNQIHVTGKDDINYKSNFESRLGNILFSLKSQNKILSYEYERRVCKGKSWSCDFVITRQDNSEIWIEMDGMMKNRKKPYDQNNPKINYYMENKLNYHIIPYTIENLENYILEIINK